MTTETTTIKAPALILREKKNKEREEKGYKVIAVPAEKTAQWHKIGFNVTDIAAVTGLSRPTIIGAVKKQHLHPKGTQYTIDVIDWALGIRKNKPRKQK